MADVGGNGMLYKLSSTLGSSEPALRLLITVLCGYPIALIYRYYLKDKTPQVQHICFTAFGFLLGYWNFGLDILHTTVNFLVVYSILKLIGGTVASVIAVFVFNLTYLIVGYVVTQTNSYDIVWTMPQCILTLRLTGLAFDVYDGHQPEENLSKDSKPVCLKKFPSLLEIAAYTYFPTSFIVGPQYPFQRYHDFVGGKFMDALEGPTSNNIKAALSRAALGFLYLILYLIGSIYYYEDYLFGQQYSDSSFLSRCWYVAIWSHIALYKYISCWLICEGSCVLIGLTYNGKDKNGESKWDGCANVNVFLFETATNFSRDYINSFNINTNNWVFQYIYKRLKFLGNKYYSQLGVLLFLSVWHGLHSGYYMAFFMEFTCVAMEKDFESILQRNKVVLDFFSRPGFDKVMWVILRLYALVFMGPSAAPLFLLSFSKWWHLHKSVYFYTHVVWMLWPLYRPIVKMLFPPCRDQKEK